MKKYLIAIGGGTVLLVGMALLVLPGPGMPVVVTGLAILATEFFWAKRALRLAKGTASRVRRKTGIREWLARFRSRRSEKAAPLIVEATSVETKRPDMTTSKTGNEAKFPSSLALAGWLAFSFGAASMAIFFPPGEWYVSLNKPSWNPPGWLFGPVWSTLYAMMAVAAWLVWREGGWAKQRKPLLLFVTQWALNTAWTPLFFGLHRPGLALLEIILLWAAIVATVAAFARVRRVAALLLVPYLLWVSFASFLNFTLWRLNP